MSSKQKTFVSAVVYVCNVEHALEQFLNKLCEVLDTNFEKFEIICVNDASTDNSNDKTSVLCFAFSQYMTCPVVAYRDDVF